MKRYSNIQDLLSLLYRERNLLHAVFQARDNFDFTYEDAMNLGNRDKGRDERSLMLLIEYGVLRLEDNILEMDDVYQGFFEETLRLNDYITSSSVNDSLAQLHSNIGYYLKEKNSFEGQRKYAKLIVRILRNIMSQVEYKTVELKRVVNDTFRHERNFEIKKQKLEEYRTTIENISLLIRQTELLLEDKKYVFENMTEIRVKNIGIDARLRFKDVFQSLIDVQRLIRDYLNQIDKHNRIIKRIRKLKFLKDQLTWERKTNVNEVMDCCDHLFFEKKQSYSTNISLPYLRNTDEGEALIRKVQQDLRTKSERKQAERIILKPEDLERKEIEVEFIDTDAIAKAFFATSLDLYTFVMNYNYKSSKKKEEKIEFYSEIILNHHSKLRITDDWQCDGNIEYPMIYNRL